MSSLLLGVKTALSLPLVLPLGVISAPDFLELMLTLTPTMTIMMMMMIVMVTRAEKVPLVLLFYISLTGEYITGKPSGC